MLAAEAFQCTKANASASFSCRHQQMIAIVHLAYFKAQGIKATKKMMALLLVELHLKVVGWPSGHLARSVAKGISPPLKWSQNAHRCNSRILLEVLSAAPAQCTCSNFRHSTAGPFTPALWCGAQETPSPFSNTEFREAITAAAVRLGRHAKYRSAGTIEFLVDNDTGKFYFLEVSPHELAPCAFSRAQALRIRFM